MNQPPMIPGRDERRRATRRTAIPRRDYGVVPLKGGGSAVQAVPTRRNPTRS